MCEGNAVQLMYGNSIGRAVAVEWEARIPVVGWEDRDWIAGEAAHSEALVPQCSVDAKHVGVRIDARKITWAASCTMSTS